MNQSNLKHKKILARRNLFKQIINGFVRYYYSEIPDLKATTKTSKLTKEVFEQLKENIKHQLPQVQIAYQDENFPKLLEFGEKLLVFMSETDNHYEKHLGYFYIMVMLKMNRYYEAWHETQYTHKFPQFEKFVEWFLQQP